MNDRSFISRLINAGIVLCQLAIFGALIYGHMGGSESGLN